MRAPLAIFFIILFPCYNRFMKKTYIFISLGALILTVIIIFALNKKTATKNTGNENEKADLIAIENPRPNQEISSPLLISGRARGYWYFEASFPVKLIDANGKQIAIIPAQAQGEWMTTEFVPFKANLIFPVPSTKTGTLILQKDNPSGLQEHDDALIVPVIFSK